MTRPSPTYWRIHARPRISATRLERLARSHGRFADLAERVLDTLRSQARAEGLLVLELPFRATDVARIARRRGVEQGLWFVLRDGRVFDAAGEPDDPRSTDYSDEVAP